MRDVVSVAAVGLLVCASCSSGSTATPTTDTVLPSRTAPLPTATPVPTNHEVVSSPAPTTMAPGTTTSHSTVVPNVSIAGEVTSPEQQAIVDVAVRSWTWYRGAIQNPNAPGLDSEMETLYVDGALDGTRDVFRQLRDNKQYVAPDPEVPATFSPVVPSVAIDGDTATMLTCEVNSGELITVGPDGKPIGLDSSPTVHRAVYGFRRLNGSWFVSRIVGEGEDVDGSSCVGHLQF